MASFRIKFPEKDQPSVIALRGERITIGRRPTNTLQVLDRTVSAFHAELLLEDGHYRIHDLDSANGTFVNGDAVTDYHLRESCKVAFGTMECEFDPADIEEAPEGLPTHAELAAVRTSNDELKEQLETVRTELAALRTESPLNPENAGAVPREEFERVVLDRAALSERLHRSEAQAQKLREELAILRRDRENLERAADSARTEVARLRATPAEAKPAPAAQVPAPAAVPVSEPAKPNLPPPSSLPQPSSIPATPVPRAIPIAASLPQSPSNAALPKPSSPSLQAAPAAVAVPRAVPRAAQPTAVPARPAASGPAGTQKIAIPETASPNATPARPVATAGKSPLKPYVRPTVSHAPAGSVKPRDPRLQPEPEVEERQEA